jgi:hypothetical protein
MLIDFHSAGITQRLNFQAIFRKKSAKKRSVQDVHGHFERFSERASRKLA